MYESWFRIRMRLSPRPVVVLDVSAAAAGLWPVLHSTLEGLAEVLPEPARPDVAFLGGSARVPLGEFLRDAGVLHAANAGRGRVISPLFEAFGHRRPVRVVVIAARPVVDLADWAATAFAKRLAVVRLDPTVALAGGAFPESDLTDVGSVARLVDLPPAAVRIGVRDGIPVGWDDLRFRLEGGYLISDTDVTDDVHVGFLSTADRPEVTAELTRLGTEPDPLPVSPSEPPEARSWQPFASRELTMLDAWRGGRPAYCPACRGDHAPGVVACPSGAWAFPSLARVAPGEFVRLRVKMFQATFQPAGPALRLGDTRVVVRGSRPTVWRFDGEWKATAESWGLFERIAADDEFALALPAEGPR